MLTLLCSFQFFKAARHMMDITDCRDLPSLQAIIFLIIFLQSSAKLATCYSYIGIALHSAVRMGLHRSLQINFNPIELEMRKRIFWQVRKMDLYVGALLGLPVMLSDDDIDQELPQEIDDEYITATKILPQPPGKVTLLAATNAHTRLTKVLQKVVKYIYPLKGLEYAQTPSRPGQSYVVSHAKIREIEQDLQVWMEGLPMGLRPGGEVSPELARVQQLLRMSYAHVQMVLYRPFLHYVAHPYQNGNVDRRSYACAAACVSVSRNVIHITVEMKRRGLLIGAYWFTMYTTFFAILSLVFYVLENPNNSTSQDILRDANEGKEVLASLAKRSMAADRCTSTLAVSMISFFYDVIQLTYPNRASSTNSPRHSAVVPRTPTSRSANAKPKAPILSFPIAAPTAPPASTPSPIYTATSPAPVPSPKPPPTLPGNATPLLFLSTLSAAAPTNRTRPPPTKPAS